MRSDVERRTFLAAAAAALFGPPSAARSGDPLAPFARAADEGELVYAGRTRDPVRVKVSPPDGTAK